MSRSACAHVTDNSGAERALPMNNRTLDPLSLRRLDAGELVGSREPDGTHAWRGVRYAAPPVGALRWRAPQPAPRWRTPFEALQHGPIAPQYGGLLAPVPTAQHGKIVGDEDCLHLNVFAPAWAPDAVPRGAAGRPVMVWIHGGGNAVGTANTYDVAHRLAASDGVIVVTVNYRLGVLGWLAHPALQAEPGVSDAERSGNFALLDLIAALQWVQRNIGAFGGDPGRVTIFGESAGGQMTLQLLASPLAAGLFHRAIAQSPVCESFSMQEAIHGRESALESRRCGGVEIAARCWAATGRSAGVAAAHDALRGRADADIAAFLRALPAATLLESFTPGSVGIYLAPRPARDGHVLPLAPLPEVFASGEWNRVPVILGSNRDEMRTFLADKAEHVRLLGGKLPLLRDRTAYAAESGFMSRTWRALHVDAPADAMLTGGHTEVWTYRFDWDEAPALPFVRPDLLLGAAHAMEMAFVFRDVAGELDIFKVNTPFNRSGRGQVATAMGDAWTSFAREGVPQLPNGVAWPRRTRQQPHDSLLIDSERDGGLRTAPARQNIEDLKRELLESTLPAAARCRIYARTFLWAPVFDGAGNANEYDQWCKQLGHDMPAEHYRPGVEI